MNKPEWERLFKDKIVNVLTGHSDRDGPLWTHEEAVEVSTAEFEAVVENYGDTSYLENDPISEAEECMSYWESDGDDEGGSDGQQATP